MCFLSHALLGPLRTPASKILWIVCDVFVGGAAERAYLGRPQSQAQYYGSSALFSLEVQQKKLIWVVPRANRLRLVTRVNDAAPSGDAI